MVEEHWRTCHWSHLHEASYLRRSKLLHQTMDAKLTTTTKESAWSCEGMHDMAIMVQCNLSKWSGTGILTHTYMVQVVLLHGNLNVYQHGKEKIRVSYTILNEAGKHYKHFQILHMLLIMWDANYHSTTWCDMQTGIWMTYLDSTHFFDKFSYKILFISIYGLEDTNYARFKHILPVFSKTGNSWGFSHRRGTKPGSLTGGVKGWLGTDWERDCCAGVDRGWRAGPDCQIIKRNKKVLPCTGSGFRT
jgi:hypothetical protein